MSENGEGPSDPSKREFLKLGAAVVAGGVATEVARQYGLLERIGRFIGRKVEQDDIAGKMSQEAGAKLQQRDAIDKFRAEEAQKAKEESDALRAAINQQNPQNNPAGK